MSAEVRTAVASDMRSALRDAGLQVNYPDGEYYVDKWFDPDLEHAERVIVELDRMGWTIARKGGGDE
ncbi:hypothetical protein [Gluconobacter roseus]|uniref:hypothetical protein n=1 Tax=Gluconobacter roseus TaxID=586239 RepID=UPI0038D07372